METNTGEHPLLNDLVLERVFKSVEDSDLKAIRSVCRLWNQETLVRWRQTAVLVLTPFQTDKYLAFQVYRELLQSNERNDPLKLKAHPFCNYRLQGWKFNATYSGEELQFLEEYGSWISYLELVNCDFSTFAVFERLLTGGSIRHVEKLVWTNKHTLPGYGCDELENDLEDLEAAFTMKNYFRIGNYSDNPERTLFHRLKDNHSRLRQSFFQRKLRVLELNCYREETDYSGTSITEYLTRLFYCIPDVEDVTLRVQRDPDSGLFLSFLSVALMDVAKLHNGSKIRNLDIMNLCQDAHTRVAGGHFRQDARDFSLPLETLSIDCGLLPETFQDIPAIANVSKTLQVLKAFRAPFTFFPFLSLSSRVEMELLRELHLFGDVVGSLAFLRYTPNLKLLVMHQICFEKRCKLENVMKEGNLLVSEEDFVGSTIRDERRGNIAAPALSVPSLEHLDVDFYVNADSVSILANWLPNVKVAKMVLNNDSLAAVCRGWSKLEEVECLFRSEIGDMGISNLSGCSELKKFKLNALCNEGTLTSSSVDDFLELRKLRQLEICVREDVSEESEAALIEKIGSVRITRNHVEDMRRECCEWSKFLLMAGLRAN